VNAIDYLQRKLAECLAKSTPAATTTGPDAELAELRIELADAKADLEKVKGELTAAKAARATAEGARDAAKGAVAQLNKQMAALQAEKDTVSIQLVALEQSLVLTADGTLEAKDGTTTSQKEKIAQINNLLTEKRAAVAEAEAALAAAKQAHAAALAAADADYTTKLYQAQQAHAARLAAETARLQGVASAERDAQLADLRAEHGVEIDRLRAENERAILQEKEKLILANQAFEAKLLELQKSYIWLNDTLTIEKNAKSVAESQLSKATRELASLRERGSEAQQARITELEEEIRRLSGEVEAANGRIEELIQQNKAALEEKEGEFGARLDDLSARLARSEAEKSRAETAVREIEARLAQAQAEAQGTIDDLKRQLEAAKQQAITASEAYKSALATKQAEFEIDLQVAQETASAELARIREGFERERLALTQRNAEIERELEQKNQQLEAATATKGRLEAELQAARNQAAQQAAAQRALEEIRQQLQGRLSTAEAEVSRKKRELETAQEEAADERSRQAAALQKYEEHVRSLRSKLESTTGKSAADIERLTQTLVAKERELKELKNKEASFETTQTQLQEALRFVTETREKLRQAEAELASREGEGARITELQGSLRSKGEQVASLQQQLKVAETTATSQAETAQRTLGEKDAALTAARERITALEAQLASLAQRQPATPGTSESSTAPASTLSSSSSGTPGSGAGPASSSSSSSSAASITTSSSTFGQGAKKPQWTQNLPENSKGVNKSCLLGAVESTKIKDIIQLLGVTLNTGGMVSLESENFYKLLNEIANDSNLNQKIISIQSGIANLKFKIDSTTICDRLQMYGNYPRKAQGESAFSFSERLKNYTIQAGLSTSYFTRLGELIHTTYVNIKGKKQALPEYITTYFLHFRANKGGGRSPTASNPPPKNLCELMLTLLFLQAKQSYPHFNPQEFLDKAGATLDDLGQCPLVLKVLNDLLDAATDAHQSNDINGLDFYNLNKAHTIENANILANAFNSRFNNDEKQILASMAKPMTFYSQAPEEYEPIMGSTPYFLSGRPSNQQDEVELYGLDPEDSQAPISLTKEERRALEQEGQGVSLGALYFLYLQCLRDLEESGETPALNSKCPLLPKPKRSQSRSRTPKTKAKAGSHKRASTTR
jgi:chromosome segregation ATPase